MCKNGGSAAGDSANHCYTYDTNVVDENDKLFYDEDSTGHGDADDAAYKKKTMEGRRRILRYGLKYSWRPSFLATRSISKIVSVASPQRLRRVGARPRPL